MSELCSDLVSFADGELDPERAEAFRSHLPTCAACRTGLLEAIQLDARLSTLTPPASSDSPIDPPSAVPPSPRGAAGVPTPKRRYRAAAACGGALAAAAVVAIYLSGGGGSPSAFAGLRTRPYDVRFSYADAAGYRPPREHMRGDGGPAGERIPYAVLDALERHHDDHALAIARAFNGDRPAEVAAQLRALPQTPSIRSDRAAIELVTASGDNAEPILAELEALRTSADPRVARAARWNYAIQLTRLDLPLSAAAAFREIAEGGEPGWADEARGRAAPEDRRATEFRARFERAREAGKALVTAGTPVPAELVRSFPGVLREFLYDAVRTAPSRERVLALAAMAAELDRLGGAEAPHVLGDYVARAARLDFQRRAPVAAAYARLLQGGAPTAGDERALLTSSPSGDVLDIAMGAMARLDVIPAHLDAFRQMVKRAGDPWFELVLARALATADAQRSNWTGAEARLRNADGLCSRAGAYRHLSTECLGLELQLGQLYEDLHRIPEALKVLQAAVRSARSMGDWSQYSVLLWRLADTERFNSSTATARAYAHEFLRLTDDDDFKRWGHWLLAGAAVLDVDGRAARRDFEEAIRYRVPPLDAANLLSDIARLDPQPGDLARLKAWLGDIRGSADAAERVLADEIEGRLLIERDSQGGRALLERAIAAADALPHEVKASKARAGAYSVLAFDAARRGDAARVLTLVAQDLGRSPPAACAVAMVAEDERAVAVVRGADGRDLVAYDPKRDRHSAPWTVPEELARDLATCAHVQVMAPAALQGQPRVLPANLAWSYAASARGRAASSGNPPTEARTLIVTDVTPPAYLQLPPLQGRPQALDPSATLLSGPDVTPTRVLAEMSAASEIQFHTHALMDVGVSDASHLVLSPDTNGNYALTAESIRSSELRGHPIVVLAACHSAQGARYQHEPWSLPDAFLAVGARAVFAAATDVPDLEAGPFFTRVLARVRAGADPARALRDERMAALASNPSSWAADVILFE